MNLKNNTTFGAVERKSNTLNNEKNKQRIQLTRKKL